MALRTSGKVEAVGLEVKGFPSVLQEASSGVERPMAAVVGVELTEGFIKPHNMA